MQVVIKYKKDFKNTNISINGVNNIVIETNNLKKVLSKDKKVINEIAYQFCEDGKNLKDLLNCNNRSITNIITDIVNNIDSAKIAIDDKEELEDVNRYAKKESVIDITKMDIKKESELFINNSYRKDLLFEDSYNVFKQVNAVELKETFKKLNDIKSDIDKYDLSPLEKIIFIADIVKDKKYYENEDDKSQSHDLCKVINNDYCTCEGYANLFLVLCELEGIRCEKNSYIKPGTNIGHTTNLVYINDDYYNIHQFFDVDITSISKDHDNDIRYINEYNFIKSINCADLIRKGRKYKKIGIYSNLVNSINVSKEYIYDHIDSNDSLPPYIISMLRQLSEKMYKVSEHIGDSTMGGLTLCIKYSDTNLKENIINLFHHYNILSNMEISKEKLIMAIYSVRRIEHLKDPLKYKFSIGVLDNIFKDITVSDPIYRELELGDIIKIKK